MTHHQVASGDSAKLHACQPAGTEIRVDRRVPGWIMAAISKFANMLRGHVGLQPGETDAFRKEPSRLPGLPEEKSLAPGLFLPEMPHGHISLSGCHFGKEVPLEGKCSLLACIYCVHLVSHG